jgi:prepilin-type processing-associated H-X9-DG protein
LNVFRDGTSNTILLVEGVIHDFTSAGQLGVDFRANLVNATYFYNQKPTNCLSLRGIGRSSTTTVTSATSRGTGDWGPGWRAYDVFSTYNVGAFTLLPPNSPSCASGAWGGVSASSEHNGGVQSVFADGSVRFIPDTIHTKNLDIAAAIGHAPSGQHDNWVPATPIAATTGGTDAVAGQRFSYGVWAELGAVNGGGATSF